jgi:hypothetical protein
MRNPAKSRNFDDGASKHIPRASSFLSARAVKLGLFGVPYWSRLDYNSIMLFTQAVCPVQYLMRKHPTLIIAQKEITSVVYFSRYLTSFFII